MINDKDSNMPQGPILTPKNKALESFDDSCESNSNGYSCEDSIGLVLIDLISKDQSIEISNNSTNYT